MENTKKAILFILLCFLAFSFSIPASATKTYEDSAKEKGYSISAYNIDIVVDKYGNMDTTETIDAYILFRRTGIIRKFQRSYNITREDGMTLIVSNEISDVTSEHEFVDVHPRTSKLNSQHNREVRLGNQYRYVTGEQQYQFSYKRKTGNDQFTTCDKLICNLTDPYWNTFVHNVTFSITMPENFDASQIKFTTTGTNSSDYKPFVDYEVNGNTIKGTLRPYIAPYENLNIEITLPDGYFVPQKEIKLDSVGYILACTLLAFVAFILWFLFGKDRKPIVGIEFYPPKDMSALEVAYWYKGNLTSEDAICTLLELENKGYLKLDIKEDKSFTITHLKSYDGNSLTERKLYNSIFEHGKVVTKQQLLPHIKNIFKDTVSVLQTGKDALHVYTSKSLWIKTVIMVIIIALLYLTIGFSPLTTLFRSNLTYILVAIPILLCATILIKKELKNLTNQKLQKAGFSTKTIEKYKSNSASRLIQAAFLALPILLVIIISKESLLSSLFATVASLEYIIQILVFLISFTITILCFKHANKRTKESLCNYEKVLSFRNFLETAEKDRIDFLINEDPNYFKSIIPYVHALDISEKWSDKIKVFSEGMPEWYVEAQRIEAASLATVNAVKKISNPIIEVENANRFGGRNYN